MRNIALSIVLLLIFITSCDNNFWGYNYDAPALINITRIQGNLSDKFSDKPIHPANVIVNGQETWTDENGNYLLNYIIPDDVEPNQQEIGNLSIIAPDYLHFNTTFIIYPVENIINFKLEYAPPIIINAVSHGDTTQAIIKDYQGVEDINYVSVTFNIYIDEVWQRKEFNLMEMSHINNISVYYQFIAGEHIVDLSNMSDWFRITAKDKSDNVHRMDFTINPDSTLFF
jgi:hypothetical protein